MCVTVLHMPTPAATTTPIGSTCSACGIIQKSGRSSCCGSGGSWFGNCGGGDRTKLEHTWSDGIRVCRARQVRTAVMGQQLQASRPTSGADFGDASTGVNSKTFISAALAETSTSTLMPTTVAVRANISNAALTRLSTAHKTATTVSQGITPITAIDIENPVLMATSKATTSKADSTVFKVVHRASGDMSTVSSSHTSAGASATARQNNNLLGVVIYNSMAIAIVCCC